MTKTAYRPKNSESGNASIEALFVVVFLVIPMWMLLFTLSYLGIRVQEAQSALSLGGYEILAQKTEGGTVDSNAVATTVQRAVFPNDPDSATVVTLAVNDIGWDEALNRGDTAGQPGMNEDGATEALDTLLGMVGALSGQSELTMTVSRESPFELFGATAQPIELRRFVGGSPLTYCEMEDPDFGGDFGIGLEVLSTVADVMLALFGGWQDGNRCDG